MTTREANVIKSRLAAYKAHTLLARYPLHSTVQADTLAVANTLRTSAVLLAVLLYLLFRFAPK